MQPADAKAVVSLLTAQMREHRIEQEEENMSRVVRGVLADERNGFFLVARVGAVIVGVAYVATMLSAEHGGRLGWLEELYVTPAHREQGIGSSLLGAALERAGELDLVAIELEVDVEHQRAEALYARFGFCSLPRSRWVRKLTPRASARP